MGNNLLNIALGMEKQAINAQTGRNLWNGVKSGWNWGKRALNYAFRGETPRPNVGSRYNYVTDAALAKNLHETANLNAAHNAAIVDSLNQVAKGRAYNEESVANAYERLRAAQANQKVLEGDVKASMQATSNFRPPNKSFGITDATENAMRESGYYPSFAGAEVGYHPWAEQMSREIASGQPGRVAQRVVDNARYPMVINGDGPPVTLDSLFSKAQGNRMVANINQGVINQANRDLAQATVKPQKYLLPGEQAQLRAAQQARQQAAGDWVAGRQLERYFQGQPTPQQKRVGELLRILTGAGVGAGAGYYFGNRSK